MTGTEFVVGLLSIFGLFVGGLFISMKMNSQEKKINSDQEKIDDQKIKDDVSHSTPDELLEYVKSRTPPDES